MTKPDTINVDAARAVLRDAKQMCNDCAAENPLCEGLDIHLCAPDCLVRMEAQVVLEQLTQNGEAQSLPDPKPR